MARSAGPSWISQNAGVGRYICPTGTTRKRGQEVMATPRDETPILEEPDPLDPEDAAEIAPLDSAVDFDDEQEEDQEPLDQTEAAEAGVLLDDPEDLSDEDE
jgi:hypothetical protein